MRNVTHIKFILKCSYCVRYRKSFPLCIGKFADIHDVSLVPVLPYGLYLGMLLSILNEREMRILVYN